jgi:hypothetical protein
MARAMAALLVLFSVVKALQQPIQHHKWHVRICHFGQGAGSLSDVSILRREFELAGFFVSRVLVHQANMTHGIMMPDRSRDILAMPADINLFLEAEVHVWVLAIMHGTSKPGLQNWLMVNEDFTSAHVEMHQLFDVTLCKTRSAQQAITRFYSQHEIQSRVERVGFTSSPQGIAQHVPNSKQVLHAAGKSWTKSTAAVLLCWLANPSFPKLHIVCTCPQVLLPFSTQC